MPDITTQHKIISISIFQRENYLFQLNKAKSYYQNLSAFGWFLTLGSEALGMLTAVTSGKEAKDIDYEIKRTEGEIRLLRETKKELEAKL